MTANPTQTLVPHSAGELAVSAAASQAKALVEAKFTMAIHRPRSMADVRATILSACKRPKFAEIARYRKPVGGGQSVSGPSIRFAEEAVRAMGNVDVQTNLLFEDDEKRLVRISVIDLETNTTYGDDVAISKLIERKQGNLRGREVVSERKNSANETVFICKATEDELAIKMAAAKSKVIRNSGLRLVPSDIVEEAMEHVNRTLSGEGGDPKAEAKKVLDAMGTMGVKPKDVEKYLGHSPDAMSPAEIANLREIYTAIKEGEATWASFLDGQPGPDDPPPLSKKEPGNATTPPAPNPGGEPESGGDTPADEPAELTDHILSKLKDEGITEGQFLAVLKSLGHAKKSATHLSEVLSGVLVGVLDDWETFLALAKDHMVKAGK